MRKYIFVRILSAYLVLGVSSALMAQDNEYEACKHSADLSQRVLSCQRVIESTDDPKVLLRAHNTRGLALCDTNKCDEAVNDFNEVIRLNPKIAGYFDNRARALRAAHRTQEALADSERAIRMAPAYGFVYIGKAHALEDSDKFSEALEIVQAVLVKDPNNAGLFEFRGKLLGDLGRYDEAYASYQQSQALNSERPGLFKTKALTEKAQGRWSDALADLNRYPGNGFDNEEVSTLRTEISNEIRNAESKEAAIREAAAAKEENARRQAAREEAIRQEALEAARREAADEARKQEAVRQQAIEEIRRQEAAKQQALAELRNQEAERQERARKEEASREAAREAAREVARQEIAKQQEQDRKKIAQAASTSAEEGRSEAPMSKDEALRVQKGLAEMISQINALKEALDEEKRLKDVSGGDAPTIQATIVAIQLRIELVQKNYDQHSERMNRYLTTIRPEDRDLYKTARSATQTFPRVPYFIPGTPETGEFWIEPKVSETGALAYLFKFVDPGSDFEKVRESISMSPAELAEVQTALAKVRQWSVMAHQNAVRKVYSKRAVCFPQSDCPPDGETIDSKASTEIRFNVYEDGSTSGQIARNKGRFVERYNVSTESALLLDAYLAYAKRVAEREFSQGTQTKQDLDKLFR